MFSGARNQAQVYNVSIEYQNVYPTKDTIRWIAEGSLPSTLNPDVFKTRRVSMKRLFTLAVIASLALASAAYAQSVPTAPGTVATGGGRDIPSPNASNRVPN
jgi:hypothetical protein